ncbi:metallophosphoesterase family protein [Brassicibacter mesophilus]|uniref:metallophosphoesterase family protein n=1 Tax=Brassicibacter mesophilus TaxID=745119 RepID=UPI003D197828
MKHSKLKVAIMTDVHGNLPALKAALKRIHEDKCDYIFHTGDAIGIGPYPNECLDLMFNTKGLRMVMGNHDEWFALGLPNPRPEWMSKGEEEHQKWIHSEIDKLLKKEVARFPYTIIERYFNYEIAFTHYGLNDTERKFKEVCYNPTPDDVNNVFCDVKSDLIFYGHSHQSSDIMSKVRYLNPGSLGCCYRPIARFFILELYKDGYDIKRFQVKYDETELIKEFENRQVPQRDFILKSFYGKK